MSACFHPLSIILTYFLLVIFRIEIYDPAQLHLPCSPAWIQISVSAFHLFFDFPHLVGVCHHCYFNFHFPLQLCVPVSQLM